MLFMNPEACIILAIKAKRTNPKLCVGLGKGLMPRGPPAGPRFIQGSGTGRLVAEDKRK